MEFLKLLLVVNLIFIAVKTVTGNVSLDKKNYRIDRESMEIIHYDISLIIYTTKDDYTHADIYTKFKSYFDEQQAKGNFIFQGQSTMFFRLSHDINRIYLHVQNLKIDEAATEIIYFRNWTRKISKTYKPRLHKYDEKTQTVALYVDDIILHNFYNYRLIMKFVGSITDNTGSFFKTSYIHNKEKETFIAAANFRGAGARQIFPCWDEPDIKTNFTISIKYNKKFIAISNAETEHINLYQKVMFWTRFKTTYNISPYHVAVVLSELDYDSATVTWCRRYVAPQLEFARKVAENTTLDLKLMLPDGEFPPKVDHIVVPGFRDEGLESWGLVLYREEAVIYDEKLDSIAWKFEVARMVARKIVHQFFGNLVGQSWWSYLWLNEGIASLLAMKIVKKYIHSNLADLLAVQFQHESLRLNDHYDMPLVSEVITPEDINSLFSFTYYVKAPAFVRELEQTVGINAFEKGLNNYIVKYQLKSIDISNNTDGMFFDLLQTTLLPYDKKYITLKKRLSQLAKQKRYPILEVTRGPPGDMIKIKLSQEYVNKTYGQNLWTPVTYTIQSFSNNVHEEWLSPHNPNFHLTDIKKSDWIIVNVRQGGYYRVYYDYDIWEKLMKYLNSKKYLNIHVLNRAQIIDDAYFFLLRNKLDHHFFKNLTYYLSKETNYVAWYPMFKIMEEISSTFPFPESTEFKEHFRKIFESVLREIGYIDRVNEDAFIECLRQEAAKWACNLDSSECTASAFQKLTSRHEKPLSPVWKEWTYCNGLISANDTSRNEVLRTEVLDNNLLRFLACTKNYTIITGYIDLLKSGHFTEEKHRITVFHSIIARHARNNLVLDYILKYFKNIVRRKIKRFVVLTDIINHLYFQDQLGKVYNYARDNFSDKMFQHVVSKLNRREVEIGEIIKYFKSFIKVERIFV